MTQIDSSINFNTETNPCPFGGEIWCGEGVLDLEKAFNRSITGWHVVQKGKHYMKIAN